MEKIRIKNQLISTALLMLCAVLLITAHLSVGYAVTVGGTRQSGVYRSAVYRRCISAAAELMGEVHGETADFDVSVRLAASREGYSQETMTLERALADCIPGIEAAYSVRADGQLLGYIDDPSELFELIDAMLYGASTPLTVSARLKCDVTTAPAYVRAHTPRDVSAVMQTLRETSAVEVVGADGSAVDAVAAWMDP